MQAWRPIRENVTGDPEASFWAKVNKTETCWLWTRGQFGNSGYGSFSIRTPEGTKSVRTHRYSYEMVNGPIPDGLHVLHRCDTPLCVRPDHLFLGTPLDNARDKVVKGRLRVGNVKGESHGKAKLTDDAVRDIRARAGVRGSQAALAREYGVSPQVVNDIIKRRRWAHIE
ncbi:HNH endonuclease [Streptomyces sp. NBC_01571]|uniref:HNH endonuclease n=1 Tax=Streptomyces sp. NBC_01571 TaxID=2975883 RepID=UPI002253AEC0|nr:HNH endonuclease [Streptomyces sp. NBC_01571]MCX4578154.1 HNH endonuclease [Streptomyces sp. NBC_01571]